MGVQYPTARASERSTDELLQLVHWLTRARRGDCTPSALIDELNELLSPGETDAGLRFGKQIRAHLTLRQLPEALRASIAREMVRLTEAAWIHRRCDQLRERNARNRQASVAVASAARTRQPASCRQRESRPRRRSTSSQSSQDDGSGLADEPPPRWAEPAAAFLSDKFPTSAAADDVRCEQSSASSPATAMVEAENIRPSSASGVSTRQSRPRGSWAVDDHYVVVTPADTEMAREAVA
jgi:hypothetical protein